MRIAELASINFRFLESLLGESADDLRRVPCDDFCGDRGFGQALRGLKARALRSFAIATARFLHASS
jgi:hypothetical protein